MLSVEEEVECEPLASPTSSGDGSEHTTFKMDLRTSITSSDASRLEDALFRCVGTLQCRTQGMCDE